MIRSECLGLVKHIYLIQTIILIRLLRLSGISKICVSFADKYIITVSFTNKEATIELLVEMNTNTLFSFDNRFYIRYLFS